MWYSLSVEEYQEKLDQFVELGILPLMPKTTGVARELYRKYKATKDTFIKHALLLSLSDIISILRLREPLKRFERVISEIGINKQFAYELLKASANKKELKEIHSMDFLMRRVFNGKEEE